MLCVCAINEVKEGGVKMIDVKKNVEIACSALTLAREDHYNGANALYRLSATVTIPGIISTVELYRRLNELINQLSTLKVKANRVLIKNHEFEIDFYPKGFQMVMSNGQYAGLQLEFAEFLNNSGINGIKINSASFSDDPDESVKSVSSDFINFFPKFDSQCFGANKDELIQIANLILCKNVA